MGCNCGKTSTANGEHNPQRSKAGIVEFEYKGERPLTLFGRATGIRYHFESHGVRLRVDERDARVFDATAALRRVTP